MKKVIFGLVVVMVTFQSFAQSNNPYNKAGQDYAASLQILQRDYKEGKIKSANQETLDYYARTLPLKFEPNSKVVADVIRATQNSTVEEVVNKSSLSDFAKRTLLESLKPNADLRALVENVKRQRLSDTENELVLTSIAYTYNIGQNSQLFRGNCTVNGETGPNACTAAGAVIGAILGSAICGPLCGGVGAIVGGVIGSVKD